MRVLFIQSNGFLESLGIASLAASLEKAGHKADLLLMSHCRNLLSELKYYQPDLIGFSAITGAHMEIMNLVQFIKKHTNIQMIIGGPHATFYAEEITTEKGVDYICRGEGETALIELVDRLSQHREVHNIPNIWIHTPQGWVRNEMGLLVEDLDLMPMPKREIYYKYDFLRDMPMKRFITSLGCPYSCTYCHNTIMKREYQGKGKFVRRKSVQRVIDEVLYVKKYSALRRVHFSDDLFALDTKWLAEFAEKFPVQVGIPFSCNTRLDCTSEVIDLLDEAGCAGVTFGFESGSENLRRNYLKKFWTNEQAIEVVRHFKRHGIATMSNSMISLPGETMEEVISTVEWNAKIGFKFVRVTLFLPFPKLDLVQIAKEKGLLEREFSLKDYKPSNTNPMFNKGHSNELINLTNLFYLAVKLRLLRGFILRYLIRIKPNKLFDLIGSFLHLFQHYLFFHLQPLSTWKYFKNTLGPVRGFQCSAWLDESEDYSRNHKKRKD